MIRESDVYIIAHQLRHLIHRCDVFSDSDCFTKLPVELLLVKLFEVVAVEDLNQPTAETFIPDWHSSLKDLANCIRVTFLEDYSCYNVASILRLII
jgi:hypothetical protein